MSSLTMMHENLKNTVKNDEGSMDQNIDKTGLFFSFATNSKSVSLKLNLKLNLNRPTVLIYVISCVAVEILQLDRNQTTMQIQAFLTASSIYQFRPFEIEICIRKNLDLLNLKAISTELNAEFLRVFAS